MGQTKTINAKSNRLWHLDLKQGVPGCPPTSAHPSVRPCSGSWQAPMSRCRAGGYGGRETSRDWRETRSGDRPDLSACGRHGWFE